MRGHNLAESLLHQEEFVQEVLIVGSRVVPLYLLHHAEDLALEPRKASFRKNGERLKGKSGRDGWEMAHPKNNQKSGVVYQVCSDIYIYIYI